MIESIGFKHDLQNCDFDLAKTCLSLTVNIVNIKCNGQIMLKAIRASECFKTCS